MSRCIDADALIADCQLAQKQADRHGREFANAFYSGGGEVSTEWWCVEDMIENAPTIEPEHKKGKWITNSTIINCSVCKHCSWTKSSFKDLVMSFNYCPNCGAEMEGQDE